MTPTALISVHGAALVVLVVIATHASYLTNGFTWLDHGDIEGRRAVIEPMTEAWRAFGERYGQTSFYRPLVVTINSIDAFVYGDRPWGFHLTNVVLHALVALVSIALARLWWEMARTQSLLVGLVVAVHPFSWLMVGAIPYRQETLVTLLVYTTVSLSIASLCSSSWRRMIVWGVLASTSFLFALFAKESALWWVPLFVSAWAVFRNRTSAFPWLRRGHLVLVLSAITAIGVYGVLRMSAVPEWWRKSDGQLSWSTAIGTRAVAVGTLTARLFLPVIPPLSDATDIVEVFHPLSILTLAVFLTTCFLLRSAISSNAMKLVMAFFMIALAPATNVFPLPRFSSPHYGYIAIAEVGVIAAFVWLRFRWGKAIVLLWLIISGVSTFLGGFRFRDDGALFTREVARDSRFREGHFYLGGFLAQQGRLDEADREYQAAALVDPSAIAFVDEFSLAVNHAGVKLAMGDLDTAQELLLAAQRRLANPNHPTILYNLALIAAKQEKWERVIQLLDQYPTWTLDAALRLRTYAQVQIDNSSRNSFP